MTLNWIHKYCCTVSYHSCRKRIAGIITNTIISRFANCFDTCFCQNRMINADLIPNWLWLFYQVMVVLVIVYLFWNGIILPVLYCTLISYCGRRLSEWCSMMIWYISFTSSLLCFIFFSLLPDIMWILYMSCLYLFTLMFFLQHLTVNWCSVLLFWPGVMFSLLTVWCVPCPVPPSPCPDVEYFWRLPWPDLDWPDPRLLLTQGSLLDTDFSHPVFVFHWTYVSV